MKIHAFICTREKTLSTTTENLVSYLSRCKIEVKLIVNAKSIFSGYKKAFKEAKPGNKDIVILCHDDIEILLDEKYFLKILIEELTNVQTGFIGPAGTTELTSRAVWWDQEQWRNQKLRGFVFHGHDLNTGANPTYYGHYGPVATLDGLFLAARAEVLEKIDLGKPDYLDGDWDFYDIHYTYTAKKKGFTNKAVPILLLHNSAGELVGRDSWHENRQRFINENLDKFPIKV